jgi:phasin
MNTKTPKTPKAQTAAAESTTPFMPSMPAFEFPSAFRELAERSVSQARDTYAKMRTAAEEATDLVGGTLETVRDGASAMSLKALEAARSNTDASFALMRDLFGAKTLSEVIELQSTFARKQFEATVAQFKDLQQLSEKLISDTSKPVTQQVEKTFKELKVA